MKITCNSCGSKYTIADAKVQGKKVKVRCKECKESILVDGTALVEGATSDDESVDEAAPFDVSVEVSGGSSEPNAEPAAAFAPRAGGLPASGAKKGLWSVNLTDDDSRDMTMEELVAAWNNGTLTSDAYVWKDGMGDWKPILEVGELKLKLGTPKKGGVVSSATAGAQKAGGPPKAKDKMGDLFGTDSAGVISSEPDRPAFGAGTEKPTGARNDSSVLFSLDSLNAAAAAPTKAQQKANADDLFGNLGSGGGGSGLLGSNVDLLMAPAKDPPPAPVGVRVAAPVAAAPEKKGKGGLIAMVVGGAVLVGAAVFFMSGSGGNSAEADAKVAAAQAQAAEALKAAEDAKKQSEEEKKKLEGDLKSAREEAAKKAATPAPADAAAALAAATATAEADKKAADKPATPGATGEKPAAGDAKDTAKPAAAPAGGGAFDVGAAKAALAAASANAAACAKPGGPTGAGKVEVTFAPSGRVTAANVISGPFGGTAVGGCVASTFRRARVPAFSGSAQTVAKGFSIK